MGPDDGMAFLSMGSGRVLLDAVSQALAARVSAKVYARLCVLRGRLVGNHYDARRRGMVQPGMVRHCPSTMRVRSQVGGPDFQNGQPR